MMRTSITLAVVIALTHAFSLEADSLPALIETQTEEIQAAPSPFLDREGASELARLAFGPRPRRALAPNLYQEGDVETLATPIQLNTHRAQVMGSRPTMVGKIEVAGAKSLRLHVTGAAPDAVLWVTGSEDAEPVRFEPSELATWTPTTHGDTVFIAAEGDVSGITIAKLTLGARQIETDSACMRDVPCANNPDLPELADAARAIALLRFVRGNASYVCTGGLVNDAIGSRTPYLLTAQHCISTAEEAASIEAVWNLGGASCGVDPVTRTYGAELVIASETTDVALLRMRKLPPNRVFLGVETNPLTEGATTFRLSHANGSSQKFSAGVVHEDGGTCAAAPRPRFVYTKPVAGAIAEGSSGAPLLLPGLRVAGQLVGLCGPAPNDTCASANDAVDGAIAASWPLLAPYLDPAQPARRRASR